MEVWPLAVWFINDCTHDSQQYCLSLPSPNALFALAGIGNSSQDGGGGGGQRSWSAGGWAPWSCWSFTAMLKDWWAGEQGASLASFACASCSMVDAALCVCACVCCLLQILYLCWSWLSSCNWSSRGCMTLRQRTPNFERHWRTTTKSLQRSKIKVRDRTRAGGSPAGIFFPWLWARRGRRPLT